jgi:hypothetical protein
MVATGFAWRIPSACAEVIISEIMFNPAGTDLDTSVTPNISREWTELYNTGSTAVNIGGWQFGDSADNQWASAFPAGTTIGPHEALVVTGDSTSFDLEWGTGINRIQVSSFPTQANTPGTNEIAALRNAAGVLQDTVNNYVTQNFNEPGGWPKSDGYANGHSIFLLPQSLNSTANDIGSSWKPSVWGAYGAKYRSADGENQGSPGFVDTVQQTPFGPSPDAAWSMVYMPDTQNYVKWAEYQSLLPKITTWIKDHRTEYNIQAVLQGGDIVNNNNTTDPTSGDQTSAQQWPAAQAGMFVLNGYVPYIMAAGNHDHGFTNADNRQTMINNYFKPSDNPLVDPAQGGILKGEMVNGEIQNAYYSFVAPDGRKMLIFSLEWEPRAATVAWANSIASKPEYADYSATLLTHNYLQSNQTRSTSTNVAADASGQELWDGLIKTHNNFEMTINGHFGGDGVAYLKSNNNFGRAVNQMFFNTQFETMGGNGWIRLLEFLQDGKTVRVRDYSPLLDIYRTDAAHSFTFQLSALPGLAGDFNRDGSVDGADYVLWRETNGQTGYFAADANGDQMVNALDYNVWRLNYGNHTGSGSSESVPEPSAFILLLAAGIMVAVVRPKWGWR